MSTFAILVGVVTVALAVGVSFHPSRLLAACAIMLLGVVAFSTMGSAIAYWVRPRAASTIINLAFLPLSFLSGYFYPVDQLPGVFAEIARYLPTYHFGQLAWSAMAPGREVVAFGNPTAGGAVLHVCVVAGWCIVCGVLTSVGYRRDLNRERG